jgi:plasmid stabilization system protein ParE
LEAAAEYIGRDSESYAAAFVQNVKEAAASLAHFAERGQVVPEMTLSAFAFAFQAFVDEHLQQRLVADAFAARDLAGLLDVGFRQSDRDLNTSLPV